MMILYNIYIYNKYMYISIYLSLAPSVVPYVYIYKSTCLNKILIKILQAGKSIAFTLGFFPIISKLFPTFSPSAVSWIRWITMTRTSLVVSTHLKNTLVKMGSFRQGWKFQKIWNSLKPSSYSLLSLRKWWLTRFSQHSIKRSRVDQLSINEFEEKGSP